MAVDSHSTYGKRLEVEQISNTYTSATFRIKFSLSRGSYNLIRNGMCIKLDGEIINNERHTPWNVVRNHPTNYGWNRKFNNSAVYNNTHRIIAKATEYGAADWQPSYGRQLDHNGNYAYLGYNSQVRHVLVDAEEYSEDITYYLGVGSGRTNSKNITVSMNYMDGSYDEKWMGTVTIPITTKQIPAPSTPTLTQELRNYVDGEPTVLRLIATVPSNVEGFFTLQIQDITSGTTTLKSVKGATNIYHDIPITDNYYDKTWYYRARIYGADIDKRSSTMSVYIEYPILPIWYYLTADDKTRLGVSHNRMQVKQAFYYDSNGNGHKIKLFAYNNGGSFET